MDFEERDEPVEEPEYQDVHPAGAALAGADALPVAVQDVVQVEEAISAADEAHSGNVSAWLFCANAPPVLLPIPSVSPGRDGFIWVDASDYTSAQLREVAAQLGIDESLVDVALAPWQRPRVDVRGDVALIIATLPRIDVDARRAYAAEYDLIFGPHYMVTIHRQPAVFTPVILERAGLNARRVYDDPSFLLYVVLDELIGYYAGLVEHVEEEIENMEERALIDSSDAFLADLLRLKRYVFALDHLAVQHRAIFAAILRPDFPFSYRAELERSFRDLEARLGDILASFAAAEAAVNGAFDIYVSHVSHRTNDIIRTLTLISGILLPISIVLSAFAAFAQVVPTYGSGFAVAMLASVVLTIGVALAIFQRLGWLSLRRMRPPSLRRRSRRSARREHPEPHPNRPGEH